MTKWIVCLIAGLTMFVWTMSDQIGAAPSQENEVDEAKQEKSNTEPFQFLENADNIIAKELFGSWTLNEDLSKKLGATPPWGGEGLGSARTVIFQTGENAKKDALEYLNFMLESRKQSVAQAKSDEERKTQEEKLQKWQDIFSSIYLVGEMILHGQENEKFVGPFVHVIVDGNPKVVYFRMARGTSNGKETERRDSESFFLSLARDPKGDSDLLFVGGDHTKERFIAFERVKDDKK